MQMMKPLSSKEKELVRNFAYRGGDSSYIYAFALSPLAQTCVDWFIPMWLAPNIITLLGLFATAGSLALTIIFNPTLGPNGPSWLHLVSGLVIVSLVFQPFLLVYSVYSVNSVYLVCANTHEPLLLPAGVVILSS